MESKNYLIDTNSVIDYLSKKISDSAIEFMNDVIDSTPNISVVSQIEILGYNAPKNATKLLADFVSDCTIYDLNNDVVAQTIELRKKHKCKVPDAIIAATALVHKAILITHNKKISKILVS